MEAVRERKGRETSVVWGIQLRGSDRGNLTFVRKVGRVGLEPTTTEL